MKKAVSLLMALMMTASLLAGCGSKEPEEPKVYRVLFIGNSYTHYHDMPTAYFERSAEQPDLSALPAVPAEPEIDAPAAAAGITGVRYVCDVAYAAGYPMYPAQLGEYSVIFYEGGTADIVISGIAVPGLPWTEGENSYIVDYYTNLLEFVWTEDGCTMNFMDAMDMHFVPEN